MLHRESFVFRKRSARMQKVSSCSFLSKKDLSFREIIETVLFIISALSQHVRFEKVRWKLNNIFLLINARLQGRLPFVVWIIIFVAMWGHGHNDLISYKHKNMFLILCAVYCLFNPITFLFI